MILLGTIAMIAFGYVLLDQFLTSPLVFLVLWGSHIGSMVLVVILTRNGFGWIFPAAIATLITALIIDYHRWIK